MTTRRRTDARTRRHRVRIVVGATAAAVVPWLVAQATGTQLEPAAGGRPPMEIGLPLVVITGLATSLAGWGLLVLLERWTRRARQAWTAVALTVLIVSLVPIPTVEAPTASKVYLALMHIAVAAVLIPGLPAGNDDSVAVHIETTGNVRRRA